MKKILALTALALLLAAPSLLAQVAFGQQTNTLYVAVAAEASLAVVNNTTLTELSGSAFANYTGTTNLTFSVRTTKTGGGGTIVFSIANNFTDGSSDTIPVAGNLTYSCGTASVGTACSGGSNAIVLSTNETVVSFSTDVHGSAATASVGWTLANNPTFATSTSYSTQVTYTISAT